MQGAHTLALAYNSRGAACSNSIPQPGAKTFGGLEGGGVRFGRAPGGGGFLGLQRGGGGSGTSEQLGMRPR